MDYFKGEEKKMNEEMLIKLSKYVYFDDTTGHFVLSSKAQEIIYREKNIICSYSGSNEWINNFMFELINLFTGSGPYNYAINSINHKNVIPKIWIENPESIVDYFKKSIKEPWGIAMYKTIDFIIDNLPTH